MRPVPHLHPVMAVAMGVEILGMEAAVVEVMAVDPAMAPDQAMDLDQAMALDQALQHLHSQEVLGHLSHAVIRYPLPPLLGLEERSLL